LRERFFASVAEISESCLQAGLHAAWASGRRTILFDIRRARLAGRRELREPRLARFRELLEVIFYAGAKAALSCLDSSAFGADVGRANPNGQALTRAGALDDHSIKAAQVTRNPDMRICFVSGR